MSKLPKDAMELQNLNLNQFKVFSPLNDCGYLRIESQKILSSVNTIDKLDEFMVYCGCRPLGESWYKRTPQDASSIIQSGFTFDLSDTTRRLVDDETGSQYAQNYLNIFGESRQFYSNTEENPWKEYWYSTSLTADSVECGVVTMDNKTIGLIIFFNVDV